jgi:cytochrome P450
MALTYILAVLGAVPLTWLLYTLLLAPLRHLPGPFITRFTKLWFFHRVYYGSQLNWDTLRLHQKYGKVVRLGPNHVSVSDAEDVQNIYNGHPAFEKSKWYDAFLPPNGLSNLFTDRVGQRHSQLRRQYSNMYSMTSVMASYDDFMNECVDIFSQRMHEHEKEGKELDMSWWGYCYAADAVSKVLFSKRFGYMNTGEDIGGHAKWVYRNMVYGTFVGIFDGLNFKIFWALEWLKKMGFVLVPPPAFLMDYTLSAIRKRRIERQAASDSEKSPEMHESLDLMDKMIDSHERDPAIFPEQNIFSGLVVGVIAGADTTACSITATLYYLMKTPRAMAKLREELATLGLGSSSLTSHLPFKQVQALPYLEAVIREGMRLCPAGANSFEREVPAGGLELVSGQKLPPGTVVGVNALISHYDSEVFGPDVAEFRPERWLDSDKEKLMEMNRHFLGFGLGARNCIGKHVATLAMKKWFSEVLRKFSFECVDKTQKLEAHCYTVVYLEKIAVRVKAL